MVIFTLVRLALFFKIMLFHSSCLGFSVWCLGFPAQGRRLALFCIITSFRRPLSPVIPHLMRNPGRSKCLDSCFRRNDKSASGRFFLIPCYPNHLHPVILIPWFSYSVFRLLPSVLCLLSSLHYFDFIPLLTGILYPEIVSA